MTNMAQAIEAARRDLADELEVMSRRTPTAACALKSLLTMTVGPALQCGGGEEKRLLDLAFAVAGRSRPAAERCLDALYVRGETRAKLAVVLQLAVLMSDGPSLPLAAEMLARYDALAAGRREITPAARFTRNPAELAPRPHTAILV